MVPHPLVDKEAPHFTLSDANGVVFKFPPEEGGHRVEKPIAVFFYPQSGIAFCRLGCCIVTFVSCVRSGNRIIWMHS